MSRTGPSRADPASPAGLSDILLIRLRRIGDIVMTTPAVALLKSRLPGARLTYLVEEPYRALVERHPAVDRVITLPVHQARGAFRRFLLEIRRMRFDAVLDFHGGPRASWIVLASGARLKIGYAIAGKRLLYHRRVPRAGSDGPIHSVVNHANLVRALGIEFPETDIPPLTLPDATPEEKAKVDRLAGPARGGRLVALHVGAGNRFRDWGADRAAALAWKLLGLPGVRIALIGADADREAEAAVVSALSASGESMNVLPLAGRLGLLETREIIARASLFVGPDSGPMHLAASTATPIVAVFGPTLPAHFAPWRPGPGAPATVIVQKDLACRPCPQRECLSADYRCLREITADDVFAACREILAKRT